MNLRCVYLDREFWRKVVENQIELRNLGRVLTRNEIHTNISKDEILNDSVLFQLFQDGGGRFVYDNNFPSERRIKEEESLTSSLCLCNGGICCDAEKYGFLSFNNESLMKHTFVFDTALNWIYEEKKYDNGWIDICTNEQRKNPLCNSMIINDKFICKGVDFEGVTDGLKTLLEALLPEGPQELPFHLSIFCKINNRDKGNKVYKGLNKYIAEIRPKLNPVLSLYTSSDVHNRFVLTNSYLMEVGAGFNLFKNGKADNGSEWYYYYPLAIGNNEVFMGKLKQVEKVHRNAYQNEFFRNYWGEKKNRLFDLIKQSK